VGIVEPWVERLVFFLLGVLGTGMLGGLSVGRTLARHDVRLDHLERGMAEVLKYARRTSPEEG
jgi:hypothetical protein